MALFAQYTRPGVFTNVIIGEAGAPLFGSARIPVIIGEAQEFFSFNNVELHRGSSAVADELIVNENISNQVTGFNDTFNTTYFPVVAGDGTGTVTNDVTKIQVLVDNVPSTVIYLTGSTGQFQLQDIPPQGADVQVTYYFKRTDTKISNENLTPQIPVFATLTVTSELSPLTAETLVLSVSVPGATGNKVTLFLDDPLQLSPPTNGVSDALAVQGAGTDTIHINIRKTDNSLRNLNDLVNLVTAGIATLSAGFLTAGAPSGDGADYLEAGEAPFTGGQGQNSNTVFKVANIPIVDGSNGGVVTTSPTTVQVLYDGLPMGVIAVNGAAGLITLAQPALSGHTLTITYYTNTYQNTFDILPANNVASISEVGLGPDRIDFIEGSDYTVGTASDGSSTINWGDSDTVVAGISHGSVAFGPVMIATSLVDDLVYLVQTEGGVSNGVNSAFVLEDYPVNGSGFGRITDDPTLIAVYVGPDPVSALLAGAVKVSRLSGSTKTVTLYNPPQSGQNVYVTYYRNTINNHVYTLTVVNPAAPGLGSYNVVDELGRTLPHVYFDALASSVAEGAFNTTGIVWPLNKCDLSSIANAIDEDVVLTFQDTGLTFGGTVGQQASLTTQDITFRATTVGTSGNAVTIAFTSVGSADAAAIAGAGTNALTIDILKADHATVRTITEIVALFAAYPAAATTTGGSVILASGVGFVQAAIAISLPLAGGVNAVSGTPYAVMYTVASYVPNTSQTTLTPKGGSSGTGYIDQTYIDLITDFRLTVEDPQTGSPAYRFTPGDKLVFHVSKSTAWIAGAVITDYLNPNLVIPGLITEVVTTYNTTAGDTAIISTFKQSGSEPNIGEFYFVSYTTNKTAADMALQIFTNAADAYAVYGQPSTVNRLSLGIQFMVENGAQTFGAIQVPQQPNSAYAADPDYIAAIQSLALALPGSDNHASVIVPLSTSGTVQQFLSRFLITQAAPRQEAEAIGFVGFNQFTDPVTARQNARAFKNSRIIAIGNPVAGVEITNTQTGVTLEYAVDGSMMAAGLAGLNVNPANDVATTLTLQDVVGFSRLLKRYDDPTMDQMAADGLVLLTEADGALQVRHYKSTDPSNPITSEPTCTTITDYVRQQFRADLQQFIGRKFVDSLATDVSIVCQARLVSLVSQEIIAGYKNLSVIPDASDPTLLQVAVSFKPIFSLLYINVTFTVTTNL